MKQSIACFLDRTVIMYGCGTSTTHLARNYPLILAGGSKLGISHGQFREFDENKTRLSNMSVTNEEFGRR